ncbi:DoxX family membrane protein [Sphingobacterium hungaricum]|uniref:DoxX family protein n=1 Tax=Sphingobacterium hungaricum TaxID=2082723 RepID=A0A928UT32_9SPHI|nr:DoxX family membrane protein [Sphingobacterium hungaricum]MBE8712328.1 DoxX family protein [Sphingobacterium hungaricum]
MNKISYLIIRLSVAISLFGHGLVRLPKLQTFSDGMLKEFENSMLPSILVMPLSYAIPIAEFVFGLLLLVGLFTRFSAFGSAFLMLLLMFGTCMVENFGALPSQFIHAGFCAILIHFIQSNSFALDKMNNKS